MSSRPFKEPTYRIRNEEKLERLASGSSKLQETAQEIHLQLLIISRCRCTKHLVSESIVWPRASMHASLEVPDFGIEHDKRPSESQSDDGSVCEPRADTVTTSSPPCCKAA
jgi:hypothetical protein